MAINAMELTAEELLAGASTEYSVEIPSAIVRPGSDTSENGNTISVRLKPLTIGAFQLIMKAAKEDPGMIPLLMIKETLTEPQMSLGQIKQMHLGLVEFLVAEIRKISGMTEKKNP